jgi:hypothetical protein
MKRIFLLIMITAFVTKAGAQQDVDYAVVSDADDWQLFMSNKLVNSYLNNGDKLVIITLTAGDEGNGINSFNGSSTPFYLAKERGSVYSSKFTSDFVTLSYPNTSLLPTAQTVTIYGKSMTKYVYGNIVNYFLRLPDGGPAGAGYPGTGNKSLMKLKQGTIPSISTITNSATYTWNDLVTTIYFIMFTEKGLDQQVWLNTSDLSVVTNPGDNSDHIYASTAAQEAASSRAWIGINEFVMNYSSSLPANLTANHEDIEDATGIFTMYDWSMIKDKYPSTISTSRAWLPMDYYSQKRAPVGSAPLPITLLSFTGTLKGNNALLEWSTSSELNSKEFQLEKSNDGINYHVLATIPAAGISSIEKKYSYLDIEATDINYYRLKMVDIDGLNKRSNVVVVKNSGLTQSISAVNNPFTDYISIRFSKLPKGELTIRLVDLSGRLLSSSKIYNPSSSVIRFDYNQKLSKGMYILQAESEGKLYSIKLLKD